MFYSRHLSWSAQQVNSRANLHLEIKAKKVWRWTVSPRQTSAAAVKLHERCCHLQQEGFKSVSGNEFSCTQSSRGEKPAAIVNRGSQICCNKTQTRVTLGWLTDSQNRDTRHYIKKEVELNKEEIESLIGAAKKRWNLSHVSCRIINLVQRQSSASDITQVSLKGLRL